MKVGAVVGCLYVDSKSLRNALLPITNATLDDIKLLLLDLAREATLEALEDIQRRVDALQNLPVELDDFCTYMVRGPCRLVTGGAWDILNLLFHTQECIRPARGFET